MNFRLVWPMLVAAILAPTGVHAQTRYVSDELVITFRSGPSSQNQIIRNLSSGTRMEVLEELPDEGYSRVRLSDGTEGWVLTQYLQTMPTATQRLAAAENERAAALERVATLEDRVEELENDLNEARGTLGETQSSAEEMRSELTDIRSAAANALTIRDQNETLRRQVAELTTQVDAASMEIAQLESSSRQNWFIVGAAVLFGGIVIGLIAPSLRPRRRKSSW
jgi:SH3 domain protein